MSSSTLPPRSLLNATIEHLQRHAPFDRMERTHLEFLVERLTVSYYGKGEVILSPEHGVADKFHIIKQGVVQGEQNVTRTADERTWLELHEGECFPLGAIISKRAVTSIYRAGEDTFCYELAADDFLELMRISPAFQDFCTRRIASLLEQSKQIIQAQYAHSSTEQQSLNSPLETVIRREPVTCTPETPIEQVLETMHRLGIGSMVITDGAARPLGIFTLHDVLSRVALQRRDLAEPISNVMTTRLTTLPPQAFAYEAALAMARHGFRHVLVTDNGRLTGVISEKDLFSLQRVGLRQLSTAIRQAMNLETLQQCARDIRQLIHNMLAQGVAAEQVTQFISTLNDLLTSRIIELECVDAGVDQGLFCSGQVCWIALGSEGRYEQTLNTDQDNGIIFTVPEGSTAEEMRQLLLPAAKRINLALEACGFPLCKGQIMASNPKWCLSLAEWKNTFAHWIDHGDPEALLNASIFFDFRPIFGAHALAEELREWLTRRVAGHSRFLHQMAENALRNRPPLGLVRDFVVDSRGERPNTLDLKINGITPFVDAARIYSLATGITHTNTAQRLRLAAPKLNVSSTEAEAWIDALYFIQFLRLHHQNEDLIEGKAMDNRIDPDQLNDLDRRILKEAFRQARKLQTRLALDYQL